jgi:hypothetical protein
MKVTLTRVLGVLCLLVYLPPAMAEIARDIDRRTAELKQVEAAAQNPAALNEPAVAKQIAELKASIAAGERAGADLWAQIKEGEQQREALQKEKQALIEANQRLERTQIVLGSGLIGALVTAVVGIFGAVTSSRRSRADSDLKRLDVIVRARELQQKGVPLPSDIVQGYGLAARPSGESGAAGSAPA